MFKISFKFLAGAHQLVIRCLAVILFRCLLQLRCRLGTVRLQHIHITVCQTTDIHMYYLIFLLTAQIVCLLKHFIRCGNRLGIHFVSSLCHNHVDHFVYDLYVGSL